MAELNVTGGFLVEQFKQSFSTLPDAPIKKKEVQMIMTEPYGNQDQMDELLVKSVINELTSTSKRFERLSFEVDPNLNVSNGTWIPKRFLIPDGVLKKIIIHDDLVAAIIRARETQLSSFGRPRFERSSIGYVIEPMAGVIDKISEQKDAEEKKAALTKRIQRAKALFNTCGSEEGVPEKEKMSFSEYLQMSTRNAVGLGRIATEIIRVGENKSEFHSFRPVDVGTIFHATNEKNAEDKIREQAARELDRIHNKKTESTVRYAQGDYAWIQVIEGVAKQSYTDNELYVYNFYPVLDIETMRYPVTPIDTMFSAISTHINITTHNRIYFQTGRAARGMLIFKSDDVNPMTLERIKQQFNAAINGVGNSWRMPVFSCPTDGDITWAQIDTTGQRDAEFTYLIDQNARVILSAFQMSPDELPGWSYLSKGTNSQALSEGNQEFRIEAGRDQGIRPLIAKFEDFINTHLFPLIDAELAGVCRFRLVGLDAETAEKEAIRIIQDSPLHGTYDWILEKVEKKLVGKAMGGDYPMNPQFQVILDKFFTVGEQKAFFTGDESARNDPTLKFIPNQFWFQWQQMQQAQQQMDMQQQQMQMQAANPQAPGVDTGGNADGSDPNQVENNNAGGMAPNAAQASDPSQGQAPGAEAQPTGEDLIRSIDQAQYLLNKSEKKLPESHKKLLLLHNAIVEKFRTEMNEDTDIAIKEILDILDKKK